jgi:hypothetical protein
MARLGVHSDKPTSLGTSLGRYFPGDENRVDPVPQGWSCIYRHLIDQQLYTVLQRKNLPFHQKQEKY